MSMLSSTPFSMDGVLHLRLHGEKPSRSSSDDPQESVGLDPDPQIPGIDDLELQYESNQPGGYFISLSRTIRWSGR